MKIMILLCKVTCAPVAPHFKGRGESAPIMHPVPVPGWCHKQ